tara:strand:+ start:2504 stop:2728 length:225 start_codon:yes stop_codon:yes gene_type:complete
MKLPDYLTAKESTHVTPTLNTMSLTGISLLWGVMLGLISPWWIAGAVFLLLSGYGGEINQRSKANTKLSDSISL